jgi:cytochrome P450
MSPYRPPAPEPLTPLRSLWRVMRQGDGDLLSLVPKAAYTERVTPLGYSRRGILLINDPVAVRDILTDPLDCFPKNDLMVGALAPLVGDSLFVSSGDLWRRQRQMIDPAFSQLRIHTAFPSMLAAVNDYVAQLRQRAQAGQTLSLDAAMSHLTADVICRTIFSQPLDAGTSREVFDDFTLFERSVASVDLAQLIFGKPFSPVRQPQEVLDACNRIRRHIGRLLDPRLQSLGRVDDIVGAVIAARDPQTGEGFTREELIDQLGVFFLAGHETTASALTWLFFILSQQPALAARLRAEITAVCGHSPLAFEHIRRMPLVRSVFRETLRLYPPITFIPRVAAQDCEIAGRRVKRGAMIMVSPWTTHRNRTIWSHADCFDADRFMPRTSGENATAQAEENADRPETFLAFGLGPRVCVGASFATIESSLILAELLRSFDFHPLTPGRVRPVSRLTTRPAEEILCRVVERRQPV